MKKFLATRCSYVSSKHCKCQEDFARWPETFFKTEAYDAEDAAKNYAEDDCDGQTDDVYGSGSDIHVISEDKSWKTYSVTVDYDPVFYASEVKR